MGGKYGKINKSHMLTSMTIINTKERGGTTQIWINCMLQKIKKTQQDSIIYRKSLRLWVHSIDPLKRQPKEVIEKYKTDFGRQCLWNRSKTNKI